MLGVIMAGGESRRLGLDKATVRLGGELMWQRQYRVLKSAGATRVVVIRRPGQIDLPGAECWQDKALGVGPLAGLEAALAPREANHVAVLAVDMPGIDARWFRWLAAACSPGVGAMAQHPAACEPLAAIYPAAALPEVRNRLGQGDHSLQRLAFALADAGLVILRPIAATAEGALRGINTPGDFDFWKKQSNLPGDHRLAKAPADPASSWPDLISSSL